MATTKPRITVTLTHRQHELLKAISDATGSSMSAYVSDLLESCEPVLERMATTMQKLRQLNTQRKASVVAALDEAQTAIEPVMNAVLGQFDLFASQVERAVGAVEGSASGSGAPPTAQAADPRLVITGVNPPAKPAAKGASKRVRKAVS
jgi:uncharacterized protein (DUF1778 family)